MKPLYILLVIGLLALAAYQLSTSASPPTTQPSTQPVKEGENMPDKIEKTEAEWKQLLTPEQYKVLREKGTERPFTNKYDKAKDKGTYVCAACGNELFDSNAKFDSGCGWPSFDQAKPGSVKEIADLSHGMVRTEVVCARCGGHLGHVFDDGPTQSHLRYCMNSISMELKKADDAKKTDEPKKSDEVKKEAP
jgi:peptide-methionine (R)-S-oxide reductase